MQPTERALKRPVTLARRPAVLIQPRPRAKGLAWNLYESLLWLVLTSSSFEASMRETRAQKKAHDSCWTARPRQQKPSSDLTRKCLLTYIGSMVVTPDREPDVFGAISHPARRRML